MTTQQFIYGFDLIDPIRLQVDKINQLQVYSFIKSGKEKLIATYEFNEFGRVTSCKKFRTVGGWTAYPPLNDPEASKKLETKFVEESKQEIIDKYIYSPLGNLIKIETHNITTGRMTAIKNIAYENNKIVSINSDEKKTTIERNEGGEIESILYSPSLMNGFSQSMEYKFIRNIDKILIGRNWSYIINQKTSLIAKEIFTYNEYDQIIESVLILDEKESNERVITKLDYTNINSNLISSTETYENDEHTSTYKYLYDNEQRIVKHIIQQKNLNKGDEIVTKYVWT